MSRKILCSRCGRIVDVDHECPNKLKDTRKKTQLQNTRWTRIRDEVRRRDGCCILCFMEGRFNKGYCVHHIIERSVDDSDENVYNEDRCVFLCKDCHKRVHETKTSWKDYVSTFKKYIEECK